MGGAYLAVSNDGAGPRYNPAGVAALSRPLLATSYRAMKLDRKLGYATALFPIHGDAVLGGYYMFAGSGSVDARDSDGDLMGYSIDQNSHQFTIVFAKRFKRFLSLGVNISYMAAFMPEMDANTVGFDFGAMFYVESLIDRDRRETLPVRDLQFGLVLRNFAKEFRWTSEKYYRLHFTDGTGTEQTDEVPIEFGLGASGRLFERKLLLATDVVKDTERGVEFRAGSEYHLTKEFALRGGWGDGRFTTGTGYIFKMGGQTLAIDYAFSTDKADEGSEHIFSFDLLF
jgi:hypothetical protein